MSEEDVSNMADEILGLVNAEMSDEDRQELKQHMQLALLRVESRTILRCMSALGDLI